MLVGVLTWSASGARAGVSQTPTERNDQAHATSATHAMRGMVKSVGVARLVIARSGTTPGDVTFVLTSSTLREGALTVGAVVSVRYFMSGATLVATAVVVRMHPQARPPATARRGGIPPLLAVGALSPGGHGSGLCG